MGYEVKRFLKVGDATEELEELYLDGWRLVTVISPFAVSASEGKVVKSFNKLFGLLSDNIAVEKDSHLYIYAVEYFLEREKK